MIPYTIADFIKIDGTQTHQRKFGETHFVQHRETGEKGVLKLLKKENLSENLLSQLKREAQLSFSEKGLPEILATYENDTYFSFVKRYQSGIPWKEYCDTLSDKDFYAHLPKAVVQLLSLLHSIHEKGFIHGDVKPSNILIQAYSPTDFQLELIDFGMSFPIGFQTDEKLPFSLGFSAPEILLNHLELANETTDFFALGITIYNLFTGKIPLAHPNPELFINLQLTHPIPKHSHIPKSVFTLIEKMTVKPNFALPPNQLSKEEIKVLLLESINNRLNYKYLISKFKGLNLKRKWLGIF